MPMKETDAPVGQVPDPQSNQATKMERDVATVTELSIPVEHIVI